MKMRIGKTKWYFDGKEVWHWCKGFRSGWKKKTFTLNRVDNNRCRCCSRKMPRRVLFFHRLGQL